MGKIIRDERYINVLWCLCNNEEEYLQFAKDLWLFSGKDHDLLYETHRIEDERWFTDAAEWSYLFDVDPIGGIDIEDGEEIEWEKPVDPINDVYEIKEKPEKDEYPVVVHYDDYHKIVLWMSLKKLANKENIK